MVNPLRWKTLGLLAALVVVGSMVTPGATAQEMVPTPAIDLPSDAGPVATPGTNPSPTSTADGVVVGDVVGDSDTRYQPLSSYLMAGATMIDPHAESLALTESSGTWLRRGLWYADLEAVVMTRTWNSDRLVFGEEYDSIQVQQIVQFAVDADTITPIQSDELGGSSPGAEGMPRFSLGRFLFRDTSNRDHTTEMVVFGGGEWNDQQGLEAQLTTPGTGLSGGPNNRFLGLRVPSSIDGTQLTNIDESDGRISFDGSDRMDIAYRSRFHSWEWNYSVIERMRKDRMELDPNGQWVRRASPGVTWDYLAGLRYFDLAENLIWTATNIRDISAITPTADGDYRANASNNIFAAQVGAGLTYDSDRWNVSIYTKHGFGVNDGRITAGITYTDLPDNVDDPGFARDNHENAISYIGQGGVVGRYHLRPNLSLRAGWEYLFVTGVALAPNQLDFNPAADRLDLTGDVFYQGFSCGTEYYW